MPHGSLLLRFRLHEAALCLEVDVPCFDPARNIANRLEDLVPFVNVSLQDEAHLVAFVLRSEVQGVGLLHSTELRARTAPRVLLHFSQNVPAECLAARRDRRDGERRDIQPGRSARSEEGRAARYGLEARWNEEGLHPGLRSGGQTLQGEPRPEGTHSQKVRDPRGDSRSCAPDRSRGHRPRGAGPVRQGESEEIGFCFQPPRHGLPRRACKFLQKVRTGAATDKGQAWSERLAQSTLQENPPAPGTKRLARRPWGIRSSWQPYDLWQGGHQI